MVTWLSALFDCLTCKIISLLYLILWTFGIMVYCDLYWWLALHCQHITHSSIEADELWLGVLLSFTARWCCNCQKSAFFLLLMFFVVCVQSAAHIQLACLLRQICPRSVLARLRQASSLQSVHQSLVVSVEMLCCSVCCMYHVPCQPTLLLCCPTLHWWQGWTETCIANLSSKAANKATMSVNGLFIGRWIQYMTQSLSQSQRGVTASSDWLKICCGQSNSPVFQRCAKRLGVFRLLLVV